MDESGIKSAVWTGQQQCIFGLSLMAGSKMSRNQQDSSENEKIQHQHKSDVQDRMEKKKMNDENYNLTKQLTNQLSTFEQGKIINPETNFLVPMLPVAFSTEDKNNLLASFADKFAAFSMLSADEKQKLLAEKAQLIVWENEKRNSQKKFALPISTPKKHLFSRVIDRRKIKDAAVATFAGKLALKKAEELDMTEFPHTGGQINFEKSTFNFAPSKHDTRAYNWMSHGIPSTGPLKRARNPVDTMDKVLHWQKRNPGIPRPRLGISNAKKALREVCMEKGYFEPLFDRSTLESRQGLFETLTNVNPSLVNWKTGTSAWLKNVSTLFLTFFN